MEKVHPAFGKTVESGGILGSLLEDTKTIGNGLAAGIEDLSMAMEQVREPAAALEDKFDNKPSFDPAPTPRPSF